MRSDPLRPRLRYRERLGDIWVRYETRPPEPHEIAQAAEIQARTGEPVEVFGDTPSGRNYPGIDGTIGEPPRPLSLKSGGVAAHPNYARFAAEEALRAAQAQGYSHVEVHIRMRGSTIADIRAAWDAPPPQAAQAAGGPVFDPAGTVAKIVIEGLDGIWTLEPPLTGPAPPGVRIGAGKTEEER